MTFDLSGNGMVGFSRDTLVALRTVLFRDAGPSAAAFLQEAGYSGGGALLDAFTRWASGRGFGSPDSMTTDEFERRATEFFGDLGWGRVSLSVLHDSVVTLDSANWAEADPASAMQFPGCYLSAAMLADFFGRIAGSQLVGMEVECRSSGGSRCRFILGSPGTIQHVYEELTRGVGYDDALKAMS